MSEPREVVPTTPTMPRRRQTAPTPPPAAISTPPTMPTVPVLLSLPEVAARRRRTEKVSHQTEVADAPTTTESKANKKPDKRRVPKLEPLALLNDFWSSGSGKIVMGGLAVCALLIAISILRGPRTTAVNVEAENEPLPDILVIDEGEPVESLWPNDITSKGDSTVDSGQETGTESNMAENGPVFRQAAKTLPAGTVPRLPPADASGDSNLPVPDSRYSPPAANSPGSAGGTYSTGAGVDANTNPPWVPPTQYPSTQNTGPSTGLQRSESAVPQYPSTGFPR